MDRLESRNNQQIIIGYGRWRGEEMMVVLKSSKDSNAVDMIERDHLNKNAGNLG